MSRQAMWLEAIERRISSTGSMLSSIKGVKMLGLTEFLMTCVHGLRLAELKISKKFRKLLVWNMGFGKYQLSLLIYLATVSNDPCSLVDSHFCANFHIRSLHRHCAQQRKRVPSQYVDCLHLLVTLCSFSRSALVSCYGLVGIYGICWLFCTNSRIPSKGEPRGLSE
jgi:hypothetical protein